MTLSKKSYFKYYFWYYQKSEVKEMDAGFLRLLVQLKKHFFM